MSSILFSNINYVDKNFNLVPSSYVGVCDGKITLLSTKKPSHTILSSYARIYDGADKLLMPGLVNSHCHAPMTLLRSYAENLPLQSWLFDKVFPFEAKLTKDDIYWGTSLAIAEMLKFGVISFSDMYYHTKEIIDACLESGIKANVSDSLIAFDSCDFSSTQLSKQNACCAHYLKDCARKAEDRVRLDWCIHAEYTSNPHTISGFLEEAACAGARIQVHVSETQKEHEECKERHGGLSPVQYFNKLGLFNLPTTAAHCVWVEDEDIAILSDNKVNIALNPVSNMKLGSGFAPVRKLLDAKLNVALGTDGCASNNNLNMFQDMYVAGLIYNGFTGNPQELNPHELLTAATRGGALSQGREMTGHIELGMDADIIVLDMDKPHWYPRFDTAAQLVYAAQGDDVVLTMVHGEILYEQGEYTTLDIERISFEVDTRAQAIAESLR